MSEPLHVVAAVIEHEGRVLACRRRAGKADAGKWEFPGGKVEAGETAAEALVREIVEELGVEIEVHDELTTDDTDVGGRVIRLTCLRATLTAGRPTSSTDHDAMRWATPAELVTLDWAAPDLPAVRLLAATAPTATPTPPGGS
ncbi:(deoxy)nucleoside triphosphate pyrophosphohydrolase [Agromyces aerolatus]|uniref:(deoxy)nucleoside triphosphate pyrophosphohydrolase n=1 Tax=Agromyces sp. LY-1074 TaxID=3074080 RepID=UPI002859D3A3|nr:MULTISPECIES: (deoxy)nucleoside triphosphate pyrophosphohydrolase [unclassified Agromyces]MDR5698552.1 (deoxy)nucleoside triphosphate pyrophosphohydrolase [Agromyces sp. LY-1074]MDR5704846.1 (deoxy)nucleoside triphosphate pyrophosphohydrolase [Agromyces sp. LY-1358]